MDFAPYQSSPPEQARLVPSPRLNSASPRASTEHNSTAAAAAARTPPPLHHPQPQRAHRASAFDGGPPSHDPFVPSGAFSSPPPPAPVVNEFDTSLGYRHDYEACMAYLALPPLGAIILLILERNSDYVRFHAWQSALLFTTIMVLHLLFSWSSFLSWVLFLADIALVALLTSRAYRDAEILDRFEVPFFGRIANRIVDDE